MRTSILAALTARTEGTNLRRRFFLLAIALTLLTPVGCSSADKPITVTRPALGTVVTINAYGENARDVNAAIDDAFAVMSAVEAELDAYSATSTIAAFNATPFEWHALPADAVQILDAIERLGVTESFSPALLGVVKLYDFGGEGYVPTEGELSAALQTASMPERDQYRFRFLGIASSTAEPGLDFGGAAKGLALDRARDALNANGAVTGALVTAGSTTVTLGSKPDGEPWRVGVEDPRDSTVVRMIAEWTGNGALSTSGDYQHYFERDGEWYHHILDPKTGTPARGTRSLTVIGRVTGLDSDILSTALFVSGPDAALAYAKSHDLGVYVIDSEGRTHIAPAPADSNISLSEQSE